MISAIVAVDNQGAIGKRGQLLCKIPADMNRFRRLTMGKTIILGRKTLATFPEGKPLEGRRNIILSRDPYFRCPGAEVYHSVEAVLNRLKQLKDEDEFFVVGGESVYRQFNGHLDRIYLTRILTTFPGLRSELLSGMSSPGSSMYSRNTIIFDPQHKGPYLLGDAAFLLCDTVS